MAAWPFESPFAPAAVQRTGNQVFFKNQKRAQDTVVTPEHFGRLPLRAPVQQFGMNLTAQTLTNTPLEPPYDTPPGHDATCAEGPTVRVAYTRKYRPGETKAQKDYCTTNVVAYPTDTCYDLQAHGERPSCVRGHTARPVGCMYYGYPTHGHVALWQCLPDTDDSGPSKDTPGPGQEKESFKK